jgi:hypothetical protein
MNKIVTNPYNEKLCSCSCPYREKNGGSRENYCNLYNIKLFRAVRPDICLETAGKEYELPKEMLKL